MCIQNCNLTYLVSCTFLCGNLHLIVEEALCVLRHWPACY
jgi:hypothetical protein